MNIKALLLARNGGNVQRYHTVATIGKQDNAAHTFHMLCMLDLLYPTASKALFKAVLYHDVAEYVTGDSPWPAKRSSHQLVEALHALERSALVQVALPQTADLCPKDKLWFQLVDALECCFYALDQLYLGNRGMTAVFWNGYHAGRDIASKLDLPGDNRVAVLLAHLIAEAQSLDIPYTSPTA